MKKRAIRKTMNIVKAKKRNNFSRISIEIILSCYIRACSKMFGLFLFKFRDEISALRFCYRASGPETAAAGFIHWSRYISFSNSPSFIRSFRIRERNSRQQGFTVRMNGMIINSLTRSKLDNIAKIHNRDT